MCPAVSSIIYDKGLCLWVQPHFSFKEWKDILFVKFIKSVFNILCEFYLSYCNYSNKIKITFLIDHSFNIVYFVPFPK